MMMKKTFIGVSILASLTAMPALADRTVTTLNDGWEFTKGRPAAPADCLSREVNFRLRTEFPGKILSMRGLAAGMDRTP